jgi:hypothetical protein
MAEPAHYLARDAAIVETSDILIGCSGTNKEVRRSGTWATIRCARRTKTPHYIVWPSGIVSSHFFEKED